MAEAVGSRPAGDEKDCMLGQKDYNEWARRVLSSPSKWKYAVWGPGVRDKEAELRAARTREIELQRALRRRKARIQQARAQRKRAMASRAQARRAQQQRASKSCSQKLADCRKQLRAAKQKRPTTVSWGVPARPKPQPYLTSPYQTPKSYVAMSGLGLSSSQKQWILPLFAGVALYFLFFDKGGKSVGEVLEAL